MQRRLFKKRIIVQVMIVLLNVFILIACNSRSSQQPAATSEETKYPKMPAGNALISDLNADPQYLNPVLSNDSNSSKVERLIFDSMLNIDGTPESNFVGRLAEKWSISEDNKSLTFYLRKDVRWHDGKPFSAKDVKFTFDMAARDDIPAIGMKSVLEMIRNIRIIDDYTIQFTFKYPYAPGLLFVGGTQIIPKHRLDKDGLERERQGRGQSGPITFLTSDYNRNPIGTGPYKLREWKTTQHLKLVRNEDYWDKVNLPSINEITFKVFTSRTTAFNVVRQGGLDIFRARPLQFINFNRMSELQMSYRGMKFFKPSCFYIGWNMRPERKFFNDKRVRVAMTHALDRQAFIDKAEYGMAHIITGPFYFKSWAYDDSIKPLEYNLDKAFRLLQEAGWKDHDGDGILDKNGVKFEFDIMIPNSSQSFAQLALILQANLKKISIETSISQFEWSVYLSRKRKGEFDAVVAGWTIGVDPDVYSIWHSSMIDTGNNSIAYSNPEVDRLLDEGRQTFGREKRQKIYRQIHRLINEDQPYTFVYCNMETYILSKRVENVNISPFGIFEFFPGQLAWSLNNTSDI